MTPKQQIERLTAWLDTYPPLPAGLSGDPELMVVQTVRRLLFTDEPVRVIHDDADREQNREMRESMNADGER